MSIRERVRASIVRALRQLASAGALGNVGERVLDDAASSWTVERPRRAEHGDYATNAPMLLTRHVGIPPRAIADELVAALASDDVVENAAVAGPGFVNLRLRARAIHEELATILASGSAYGRAVAASGERINVEFVSANPTGPITVAAARNGILGDAVASLLELTGHRVTREYYINDFGNQIRAFAESVRLAHEGRPRGERHYQGAYVAEIARHLEERSEPDPFASDDAELARTCITSMLHGIPGSKALPGIRNTLAHLGIGFDVWFSEESLHRWGNVDVAVERLRADGFLVEKDGATFFVAGDADGARDDREGNVRDGDKERVVKKSDGAWTYFASDIAYHSDKFSRGYDRVIDVWGADHQGYISRMRKVLEALGLSSSRFEVLLYQLVNILRGGVAVMSSKRAGNVVTADEVMEEIDDAAGRQGAGRDALRFFFLSRSSGATVDFDVEVAKKKSLENPVFYVQYGHARLSSILRRADAIGMARPSPEGPEQWARLDHPDELAIAIHISRWPDVLAEAAAAREPHRIVFYLQELARAFQSYFTRMKVDPILPPDSTRQQEGWERSWDFEKMAARLGWVRAIRTVHASAMAAIGISAPDRMDLPPADEEGTAADEDMVA
jgi:arginyl-tRNA synthetase